MVKIVNNDKKTKFYLLQINLENNITGKNPDDIIVISYYM